MTSKPTRFLLVSTHTEQTTGYAKVAHNLLRQLSTLHPIVKIFHFGFQRSPVRPPAPIRPLEHVVQYDAAANEEPRQQGFGFNKLAEYVDTVNPDIVFIYNDPIVVNQFLEAIKDVPKTFQTWIYLDQVYEGCDQGLLRNIEAKADRIFAFTPKWKKYLLSRIPTTEKPIDVLEHGVDTSVFKRTSDPERIATRKMLNLPPNAIAFLNVNRNSQRKRLDLTVMAFARLVQKHPELPLHMVFVTTMNPQAGAHYNPVQIYMEELKRLGVDILKFGQRVVCVDNAPPKMLDDKTIAAIYSACDYGINTANGEGFGLCQLEQLACGAPQVVVDVGDYGAFLTPEVAEIVPATIYEYLPMTAGIGTISKTAPVEEVAAAMDRILAKKNVEECVALAETRPWAKICDPFLELVAGYNKDV
jgi:glycosyltransferase involved in cell wall biosynthesis